MKTNIYTIYDRIAEEAGPLFQAVNDGVAIRRTVSFMLDLDVNSTDYKLLKIGYFENIDLQGEILPVPEEIDFQSALNKAMLNTKITEVTE